MWPFGPLMRPCRALACDHHEKPASEQGWRLALAMDEEAVDTGQAIGTWSEMHTTTLMTQLLKP